MAGRPSLDATRRGSPWAVAGSPRIMPSGSLPWVVAELGSHRAFVGSGGRSS